MMSSIALCCAMEARQKVLHQCWAFLCVLVWRHDFYQAYQEPHIIVAIWSRIDLSAPSSASWPASIFASVAVRSGSASSALLVLGRFDPVLPCRCGGTFGPESAGRRRECENRSADSRRHRGCSLHDGGASADAHSLSIVKIAGSRAERHRSVRGSGGRPAARSMAAGGRVCGCLHRLARDSHNRVSHFMTVLCAERERRRRNGPPAQRGPALMVHWSM